jgi:hypothetical protein
MIIKPTLRDICFRFISSLRKFRLSELKQLHLVSGLLSFVIASRPTLIYLNSSAEFSTRLGDVFIFSALIFLISIALLEAIGITLNRFNRNGLKTYVLGLLLLAIIFWVQGNFFLWDYGKLDGRPLNFDGFFFHGLFEIAIYTTLFFIALWQREKFLAWAGKAAFIVIASLTFAFISAYFEMPKLAWYKTNQVTYDDFYKFSKQKNIIILTIDSARSDAFEKMLSKMTAEEQAIFNGFTFFRNTTGVFNSTNPSVTGILTGQLYDFKEGATLAYSKLFDSPNSVLRQLKEAGYFTEVYPYNAGSVYLSPEFADNVKPNELAAIGDMWAKNGKDYQKLQQIAWFNFSPHFVKRVFFDSSTMYVTPEHIDVGVKEATPIHDSDKKEKLPERLKNHLDFNRSVIERFSTQAEFKDVPVFKYYHFHGAHPPFIHDENYIGMALPFTMDSYEKQFKGSLLLTVGALIESLKKEGVYDETMLIVIGDHGMYIGSDYEIDSSDQEMRYVADMLIPLLMVKPFGEAASNILISSAPVSLLDIPATIFDALGLGSQGYGQSVFSVNPNEGRERFSYVRSSGGALEYKINGDVTDLGVWAPTYRFLKPSQGKVDIPASEYRNMFESLVEVLDNSARYHINQWE